MENDNKTIHVESKQIDEPEKTYYYCGHEVQYDNLKILNCHMCYEHDLWRKIIGSEILREIDAYIQKNNVAIHKDFIHIIRGPDYGKNE